MNPSSNNVFGDTPLGQGSILMSAPEKTTNKKRWVVLVVVVLVLAGVVAAVVFLNGGWGNKRNIVDAETSLKALANYTYYGAEGYFIDLSAMNPERSYLAGALSDVFDAGTLQDYFAKSMTFYEDYAKVSRQFYGNSEAGKMLEENDAFLADVLDFLRVYIAGIPKIELGDYDSTEAKYLAKFAEISELDSSVSRNYLELQREMYALGGRVLAMYSEKGCYRNLVLSSDCVDGLEYSVDDTDLLMRLETVASNLSEYPSVLVRKFYNCCFQNDSTIQGVK